MTSPANPPVISELVETVARAIYDATHAGLSNCYSWDDEWEPHQERQRERYYKEARAVIASPPIERLLERDERMREALDLARNRLRAAAINEAPKQSREYYDYSQWADEADATLSEVTGDNA